MDRNREKKMGLLFESERDYSAIDDFHGKVVVFEGFLRFDF